MGSSQQVHRAGGQGRASLAPNTAKALQASGLMQAQGTPICPSPGLTQLAHFKPGTFNITSTTKGGKFTMQPVSLTIPISSVALNPAQPQAPHPHTQPTLLVTSSSTTNDGRASAGSVVAGGRTEIHLQPQISTASTGMIS